MERSLGISTWNAAEKRWVELPSKVNAVNNTVSAETTHFSIYTVMADISPADFVLSHITVKPSVVKEGEKVEVSALISNKGSVGGTYQAVLKLNGQEMGNQELTIDGGSNLTVHFEVIPDHTGIFSVQIGDLIGQLEVQQLPQPVFVTEEIEIESAEVNSGEEATARILIANTGSEAGTLDVILKVNGISEGFKQIEIKAGEFKEVVFNILKFDPGTYTVDINGKTASFTVVPDQTADTTNTQPDPTPVENTPEAETEFSLSMLAKVLGAGFILILGTVLAILIRRRQLIKNS
jgi:hypothetical protein